jgi:hypothetical protein
MLCRIEMAGLAETEELWMTRLAASPLTPKGWLEVTSKPPVNRPACLLSDTHLEPMTGLLLLS